MTRICHCDKIFHRWKARRSSSAWTDSGCCETACASTSSAVVEHENVMKITTQRIISHDCVKILVVYRWTARPSSSVWTDSGCGETVSAWTSSAVVEEENVMKITTKRIVSHDCENHGFVQVDGKTTQQCVDRFRVLRDRLRLDE